MTKTFTKGQKIKTVYGEHLTVMSVCENIITTYEGSLVHITKAFAI